MTWLDSGDRLPIGYWYTSLLPVHSCSPGGRVSNVVRYVFTDDTRLARRELLEEVEGDIVEGRLVMGE